MTDQRFLAAVRGQAEARAELDLQTFMGYFVPEAIEAMRGAMSGGGRRQTPVPVRSFEVLEAEADGESGRSAARRVGPPGGGSYVLKQQWRRVNESWRVAGIEKPAELVVAAGLLFRAKTFVTSLFRGPPRSGMRPGMGMRGRM
jgi:hypothetical protein